MTDEQRELARHALGLTAQKMSYRNYYAAGLGTTQEAAWDDLVKQGLAIRGRRGFAIVGFCLTDSGARAALKQGETLDPEDFAAAVGGAK